MPRVSLAVFAGSGGSGATTAGTLLLRSAARWGYSRPRRPGPASRGDRMMSR
jgi:Pyruvate/2-oxoacid:ferredoxin oxidoreductase gamma subunit